MTTAWVWTERLLPTLGSGLPRKDTSLICTTKKVFATKLRNSKSWASKQSSHQHLTLAAKHSKNSSRLSSQVRKKKFRTQSNLSRSTLRRYRHRRLRFRGA